MEVDEDLTSVNEPSILVRRERQPSSLFQLEFRNRIRKILESPNFYTRQLSSRRNSPSLASSGLSASETSEPTDNEVPKTTERRRNSEVSRTSTSSRRVLPRFRSGAAIPNSVVRSHQYNDDSPSDEKSIQKLGSSDGSILDRIFRRLLPVTEEEINDDELLLRIQKELEKRKLLTKTAKKTVAPKEEVIKKIDPEKEKRRHEQRITSVKLVQLEHSRNFETIRRSIELSKPQSKTIVTDGELFKQQNIKSSSEPIPTRMTSLIKVQSVIEEKNLNQEHDIQTNTKDTNTKKDDANDQPVPTAEINLQPKQDVIRNIPQDSMVTLKEPDMNYNDVSWQDMIKDLSELGPIKKISLLDLEAINQSIPKVDDNETTSSDQSDTENTLKRSRKRSRSNSSQKLKFENKSLGKQKEVQETENKEYEFGIIENSEFLTKALSDNAEVPNVNDGSLHISEPEIKIKRFRSKRRSSDSSTSRKTNVEVQRKSIDSSNEKKIKIGTSQKLAKGSASKKSEGARTSTDLIEMFGSKEIYLLSEIVINKDETDINNTETKRDVNKNIKKSKKQMSVTKTDEFSSSKSPLAIVLEKEDNENSDITEKSLLHEIGLLESKRKKYDSIEGKIKETLQEEVEAITEKTKILLARRRQSRSQNEVLKSNKNSTDSKIGMKIRSIDMQTKTYSNQLKKPRQENLIKKRKLSITT